MIMKKYYFMAALLAMVCLTGISSGELLNNTPSYPVITYNSTGMTTYDATNDELKIQAAPIAIMLYSGAQPIMFQPGGTLNIDLKIDDTGTLLGGDDVVLEGTVDLGSGGIKSGVLLKGTVIAFGYFNSLTPSDKFDFKIALKEGELSSLYDGYDIGIVTVSENSNFNNDFTVDFSGGAKGNIFGVTKPAAIGNFVWKDMDADGVQDSGEPGVGGVTVNLYRYAELFELTASTITDGNGFYLFENLAPGDYYVEFILPSGYVFSPQDQGGNDAFDSDADPSSGRTAVTTLVAGETDLTWDAGIYGPAALGDYVWEDLDADGVQDAGEPGINGITVNLYDCDNHYINTTTTNANGLYLFENLTPGGYYVQFVLPSGYQFSPEGQGGDITQDSDADSMTGKTACTTLAPGENDLTWDAGMYAPAALGDFVWLDENRNGIQDPGEAGVKDVLVELYACTEVGTLLTSTLTDENGYYLFDHLDPGCYYIKFIKPAGYEFSQKDNGVDDVDSDASPSGSTDQITLAAGQTDLTWDAGLVVNSTAELGDFVWEDLNANGIQDAGEPGIENVKVTLYNCLDNWVAETVTNASGFYLFENLPAGNYYVVFDKPAGYMASPLDAGIDDAQDSDANPDTGKTACTTLDTNESDRTWDAGFYKPASIGDFVWEDLNANGIQDIGEPGVAGVVVKLFDCDGNLIVKTTTDATGHYLFDQLTPGDYYIKFKVPAGYAFSAMDQGVDDALDSDAQDGNGKTICTTLESGENDFTWDAGLIQETCSLSVEKSCYVPIAPAGSFECSKPIDSMIMIWDGAQAVKIKAWKGDVGSTLLAEIDGIAPGQDVTVSGYAGSPNDVYWEVFKAGTSTKLGESTFHLSCSDQDMNGPEDCGALEGDGKGNKKSKGKKGKDATGNYLNQWILAGMSDSQGSFNCLSSTPGSDAQIQNCELTIPSQVECDGKLTALELKYVGGNCSQTTNWQSGKVTCSGNAALNQPVKIVMKKDADKVTVIPSDESIMIGQKFTILADKELKADTQFDIVQGGKVLQSLKIHTSCSKPLAIGDRFGSVQVVSMDLNDGSHLSHGAQVEYTYVVKNIGPVTVSHIEVEDDMLGTVPGSPISSLAPGEQVVLSATSTIDKTTTNFVTVTGQTENGGICSATDSSTVTVVTPSTECTASGKSELKLDKKKSNKFEWELYNDGADPITIETLTLGWPNSLGRLKKISIGKDAIFQAGNGPAPPSAVINGWTSDIGKRQISANKSAKLEFEFEKKAETSQNQYTIMINFVEGCAVQYIPGEVPWECNKPIDVLTMIWNGDQAIRIKAWKGAAGSTLLADIDNIGIGDKVTVSGYAGSPNDVYWEIFKAGASTKLGESTFHLSCSDQDMNGPEDCGTAQGDGKGNKSQKSKKGKKDTDSSTRYINQWLLGGMTDSMSSFECTP